MSVLTARGTRAPRLSWRASIPPGYWVVKQSSEATPSCLRNPSLNQAFRHPYAIYPFITPVREPCLTLKRLTSYESYVRKCHPPGPAPILRHHPALDWSAFVSTPLVMEVGHPNGT